MNVRELYNIFNKLKNTSGRIDKENILRANRDNEDLKRVLKFLYDDLITTGLSEKKINKAVNPIIVDEPSLDKIMKYLESHKSGTDKDIAYAKGHILKFKKEYGEEIANFVKSVIIKDYPAGVSKITLNKIFGKDFIFKFDVRKGSKFEGELKPNVVYSQSIKIDGIRNIALVDDKGVKMFARSGKLNEGLKTLEEALLKLYEETKKPMMFDGELLSFNDDNLTSDELFKVTSGKLRKDGIKTDIQYILFDCMPLEEFIEGKSKLKYIKRREELIKYFETLNSYTLGDKQGRTYFTYVGSLYRGNDISEIQRVQKLVEEQGYEGTMLDDINAYYTASRTKTLLKFKTFYTVDLVVTGLVEHVRKDKLGSIVVDYKGHSLQVGSGFTDKERKMYWENPELLINKVVEVGYFEESKDKNGKLSLRFPTFKRVRDDKEVEDVSYH